MEEIIHKIQYLSQMKELIENKRNIYIYGAKSNAKKMSQWFMKYHYRFKGYLVSKKYDNPDIIDNVPVYRLENLWNIEDNDIVIIAVGAKTTNLSGIIESLSKRGFKGIIVPMKSFFNDAGNSFLSKTCMINENSFLDDSAVIWADETSQICIEEYVTINANAKIVAYNNSKIHIGKNSYIEENAEIESTNGGRINIGESVYFDQNARILAQRNADIQIGEALKCGKYAYFTIANGGKLIVKDDCLMSSFVKIAAGNHRLIHAEDNKMASNMPYIEIGKHVWVGMGANILGGAVIGEHSVVGAATLVAKEIERHVTCAGNPAKIISKNVDWKY